MKKLWWLLAVTVALLFFYSRLPIAHSAPEADLDPEAQVLVKYESNRISPKAASSFRQPTAGGDVVEMIPEIGVKTLQYDSREEAAAAALTLERNPAVVYAERNTPSVRLLTTPNDPKYGSQWHLPKISAPDAWNYQKGATTTTIAIIDTGVDGTHADLSGKVLAGGSFVGSAHVDLGANGDSDPCGHGTAVAGLAAAHTNNSIGIAGLDWQARILPVRVIDNSAPLNCNFGYIEDLIEAIIWSANVGAKIINVSLGTSENSPALRDAVVYAKNRGSMVVAAAGNGGGVLYPAAYDEAIAVGASNAVDSVTAFSSTGAAVDLIAPGDGIWTTCDPDGSDFSCTSGDPYATFTGTSASTPLVSGALGLALARNPGMIGQDFIEAAQRGVDKVSGMNGANFTVSYGYGRLNAHKILWAFQDYHAQFASQNGYPTLAGGQTHKFVVGFKNTGKSTWYQSDPSVTVNLGTDRGRDRIPGFVREGGSPSGWRSSNRIELKEASVAPGATGTFEFWYRTPTDKEVGVYREYFRPVADGWDWLEDWGVYWDVVVPTLEEQYHYAFAGQSFSEKTVRRGEGIEFVLTVKNTGSATWLREQVNLGTDRGRDRVPGWLREGSGPSGWMKDNRIRLEQSSVVPGGTGSFRFWLTAPPDKAFGTYREYFRVVADGITWMEDYGIYWDVTVVP